MVSLDHSVPPTPVGESPPRTERGAHRLPGLVVVGVFLALIAGVPLLQTAVDLREGDGVQALEVFQQRPTSINLRAYEHRLEEASVFARTLRPWFQFAQFAWLKDGGEKALIGRDGWLFYKPGFDATVARAQTAARRTNDAVATILAFREALAARGIQLLVLPVPNKESVYPDQLTSRATPGRTVVAPATRDLLTRLASAQVECVDLFGLFADARAAASDGNASPLYLTQDSHWSPAGVALAARVVAQRLIERGWASPGGVVFREEPASVERLGDVLRMLQSARLERAARPERIASVQVVHADTGQPYQDDSKSEVLILGDSFLRIYQQDEPGAAGFIAHLAKELGQPLTSLVSDGGASTLVRQELHRRPALLQGKRVVVWEFVERDILLGAEGWQQVPLPAQP